MPKLAVECEQNEVAKLRGGFCSYVHTTPIKNEKINAIATKLGVAITPGIHSLVAGLPVLFSKETTESWESIVSLAHKIMLCCLACESTLWIVGERYRHPYIELIDVNNLSFWLEENIGKGEHGFLISPIKGNIIFLLRIEKMTRMARFLFQQENVVRIYMAL